MLENEKYEINKWLCSKWPEVFSSEDGMTKLAEKIEKIEAKMSKKDKEPVKDPKIVLETDLYPHIIQRIDHYLYKKWPDLFVDENFKEFKRDIQAKYDDIQGKENRINARYQEWQSELGRKYEHALIDIQGMRVQIEFLRKRVLQLEKKKWYQFWVKEDLTEDQND